MKRVETAFALSCLCLLAPLSGYADVPVTHRNVVQISQPPAVTPQTQPLNAIPGASSPVSVDNPDNAADYIRFEPYNTYPRELDLWNLEGRHFVRSLPVLSPDKSQFAYTEVVFMANVRQTMTKIYLVPVQPPDNAPEHLPSEDALYSQPVPDPARNFDRFNPDKTIKLRQELVGVGYNKVNPFDFRTLTIVDWSASGQRLLFKQRSGALHVGLRTSDILLYDQGRGTVTIYPEVHRVIENYWKTQGNLPHVEKVAWDIQPVGWEPGSDSAVLLKAWAYDKTEKKYLGLWRYDIDAERTELMSMDDQLPPTVAANGWLASPLPVPPPPRESHWHRKQKTTTQATRSSGI